MLGSVVEAAVGSIRPIFCELGPDDVSLGLLARSGTFGGTGGDCGSIGAIFSE